MQWSKGLTVLVRIAQLLVGATFLLSSLLKGIDPVGTAIKIGEYGGIISLSLSNNVTLVASFLLIVVEWLIGVALVIGYRPNITRWVLLVTMVGMTLLTLYLYIFEPVSDCGCFGDALVISNRATFLKNLVLLAAALLLFYHSNGWYHWIYGRSGDIVVAIGVVVMILFGGMNVRHLPVIDFRPYKVGSDLMELTQTGGTEGEYIYRFVYRKGDKEETFGIDEIESLDDSWTFVRDDVEEVRAPIPPAGASFILLRNDGTNVVESLAYEGQMALLLIAPEVTKVSPDLLRELADSHLPITLVTGSSGDIWQYPEYQGLDKSFVEVLFLDHTTAKTVVRSNPGLVVIKGGKIVNKLSISDLLGRIRTNEFKENPYQSRSSTDEVLRYLSTFGIIGLYVVILLFLGIYIRKK